MIKLRIFIVSGNPKKRQCTMTTDEQTITDSGTKTTQRTGRHSSRPEEVLFFPTAHFLFFNFSHRTFGTFAFAPTARADPKAKAKEPNLPTHLFNFSSFKQF